MTKHSIDALVSSRICHDLISPVGAISNGIELLEGLASAMPEIGLIADSVDTAKIKLQFFRVCFGQYSVGAVMGLGEVMQLGTGMVQTKRLRLNWDLKTDSCPREQVKLLFLMLLCAETTLPVGGTINVTQQDQGFVIQADGKRIQLDDAWDTFTGQRGTAEVTPARVQFPLAATLAIDIGRSIAVEETETSLTITF